MLPYVSVPHLQTVVDTAVIAVTTVDPYQHPVSPVIRSGRHIASPRAI